MSQNIRTIKKLLYNVSMKYFLILLTIFCNHLNAAELISEGSGNFSQIEIILTDKSKVSTFTTTGTFKNNIGKYGSFVCIGFIDRKSSGEINKLENICESIDQNGIKMWTKGSRSKSDIKAGVGKSFIVDSTSKHKKILIGTECKYAVNYVRELSFARTICKVNDNDFEVLQND